MATMDDDLDDKDGIWPKELEGDLKLVCITPHSESGSSYGDSNGDERDSHGQRDLRKKKHLNRFKIKGPDFNKIPNELLLQIFSFLHFKDMCRLRRVNKRWKTVLDDRRLWTHVTIGNIGNSYNVAKEFRRVLVKLMKAHFGPDLLYLDSSIMNKAGLRYLDQKCPNLLSLIVRVEDPMMDLSSVPSRLTFLEIQVGSGISEPPRGWWVKVKRHHFPNLRSLSIDAETICGSYCEFDPFQRFLRQIGRFKGLQHLKLFLNWDSINSAYQRQQPLQALDPVARTLLSFSIRYNESNSSCQALPDLVYKYIGDTMEPLKHLKISIEKGKDGVKWFQYLTTLPNLETLYLIPDVAMADLQVILPQYLKLQTLYLHNVDNKLQQWVSAYIPGRQKYKPYKKDNAVLWKEVQKELKLFCPDVMFHIIQDLKHHRMASAIPSTAD